MTASEIVESAAVDHDYVQFCRSRIGEPCEDLLAATLMGAITDAIRVARSPDVQLLRRAALRWMAVRDYEWPFSFASICSHFELDPDAVEEAVRRRGRETTH